MRRVLRYFRFCGDFNNSIKILIGAATAGMLCTVASGAALAYGRYGPEHYERPIFEVPEARGFGRLFRLKRPDDPQSPGLPAQKSQFDELGELGHTLVEHGDPNDPAGDSELPSGYVYFGQFIDHDITFDTSTELGDKIRSDAELENARTPELDLDNVYGGGPVQTPYLYRMPYLRVGRQISNGGAPRYDLFRTPGSHREGPRGGRPVALIGDPRDDQNLILAQLHAAFVDFHNRTVDILVQRYFTDHERVCGEEKLCDNRIAAEHLPGDVQIHLFEDARDHVIHYYHRLILEDYLPRVIGPRRVVDLLNHGRDFFYPDGFRDDRDHMYEPLIPVEFAAAVFRMSHSQVRQTYTLHENVRVDIFGGDDRAGVYAFSPLTPEFVIDWRYFFDIDPTAPQGFNYARRLDPLIVPALQRLQAARVVGPNDVGELAVRDLVRGRVLHLPAGQDVAERVLPELKERGVLDCWGWCQQRAHPLRERKPWQTFLLPPDRRTAHFLGNEGTPLWYYVLQEAAVFGTRTRLQAIPDHVGSIEGGPREPGYRRRRRGPVRDAAYQRDDEDALHDGGHRLGPVGGTIVGEVLTGLLEHYQEKTGKGLAFRPTVHGGLSLFGTPNAPLEVKPRYLLRNFLMDAGQVPSE
jgi:hypothetical protein